MHQLESSNQQWCAVYTKPQKEEFAERNLHEKGINTFFPKLVLPRPAKRNRQIVPLFPNYLFVRLDLASDEPGFVTWCPGVKRLLTFDGTPAVIEDSMIAFLMRQAAPDGTITARSNVSVGQEIVIEGGPFDGLIGIIQEPPNAQGRAKVLLQLLRRPIKVDVPVHFIKSGWVAQNY